MAGGKQTPSASILFFRTNLLYAPNIKMWRRVKSRSLHFSSICQKSPRVKQLRQIGAEMVQDSRATTWGGVAGCKIEAQGKGGVRDDSMHVVADRRGVRGAWLARGGIREHEAFLGHEIRAPAETGRGGVSMAGGRWGQGAREVNGVTGHRLPSPPYLF